MHKIMPVATALTLALSLPTAADAQDKGRGHGGGHEQRGGGDHGSQGRGHDRSERGDRDDHRGGKPERVEAARNDRRDDRGPSHNRDRDRDDRSVRVVERDVRVVNVSPERQVVYLRTAPDRGLIAGCPPGLAKKNNGCLPPGQARRVERNAYDYLWRSRTDADWRYDEGYIYRLSPQGSLLGYLPVLGGALALGNPWPTQYDYAPAPSYYTNYYGLNDRYDYRYADGILYGVDPQTRAISQVAALLTGQQWNVGQPMPAGYDVYNVPYAYRSQYADTPDRWYRYNDGYVYQVDPTTQLVQAVIQLLT